MAPASTRLLASGFGAGFAPVVPGTFGTLAAIPLAPFCWRSCQPRNRSPPSPSASPCGSRVHVRQRRRATPKDPGWIVLDEMVGFWVAVALVAADLAGWSAAFFLFRLFDILKPLPAGWFDGCVAGGRGILIDDVVAGRLYTALPVGIVRLSESCKGFVPLAG